MSTPGIVERDLHRYLRQLDFEEVREQHLQDLCEERRRYLTEDRSGMSLITEALYVEEPGYPLDEALFALVVAWRRRAGILEAAGALVALLERQAARMARQWAEGTLPRDGDDDDLPF